MKWILFHALFLAPALGSLAGCNPAPDQPTPAVQQNIEDAKRRNQALAQLEQTRREADRSRMEADAFRRQEEISRQYRDEVLQRKTEEAKADALPLANRFTLPEQGGAVQALAFSPDGKTLATGTGGLLKVGKVTLWDTTTGKQGATALNHPPNGGIYVVAFSPDGQWLVTGSTTLVKRGEGNDFFPSGQVCLFEVATGKLNKELAETHDGVTYSAVFSRDGKLLATSGNDGTVKLWELPAMKEKSALKRHQDRVGTLAFSPDGTWLASVGDDGVVVVWDVAREQPKWTLKGHDDLTPIKGQPALPRALAFAPDGSRLASGDYWGNLVVWDAVKGVQQQKAAMPNSETIHCLAFAPSGDILAAGSGAMVRFFDAATLTERGRLESHANAVFSLAYSADGKLLATGDQFRARIWEAKK
jgi:WD40 repeat protein